MAEVDGKTLEDKAREWLRERNQGHFDVADAVAFAQTQIEKENDRCYEAAASFADAFGMSIALAIRARGKKVKP